MFKSNFYKFTNLEVKFNNSSLMVKFLLLNIWKSISGVIVTTYKMPTQAQVNWDKLVLSIPRLNVKFNILIYCKKKKSK